MGRPRAKSQKSKRATTQNKTRQVEQPIVSDSQARNVSTSIIKRTEKKEKKFNKGMEKKILRQKLLYGKKKPRVYTEKELDIPKLNRAVDPGVKRIKGKKGKVFASKDTIMRILNQVADVADDSIASKLEKARKLEDIRELKRKEIEKKDEQRKIILESKKSELKNKRNISKKIKRLEEKTASRDKHSKPKVSFA